MGRSSNSFLLGVVPLQGRSSRFAVNLGQDGRNEMENAANFDL